MQAIGQVLANAGLPRFQKTLRGKEQCAGCGETVEIVEISLAGGPFKGKTAVHRLGCRCEELALVRQIMQENEEAKKRKLLRIFDESSLISPSLRNAAFETYQPTTEGLKKAKVEAMAFVKSFSLDRPANLIFTGHYGTGKSHLAVSIVRALMERGYTGIFISVPDMLTKLKETYNRSSETTEADILEALKTVDVLVLDDIGAEYSGSAESWAVTKIFEVVNARSGRHTIYTTNLNSEQLQLKIGDRNFSRMCERAHVIKMHGPDYRRKTMW
ncbi:ATP-binding protein [Effusibacillus pohliae]|uniref:ATP-binding protein n=1 Tax=Effusibacillus pohliae TaxID=232270 RepID=UPI0003825EF9|nr:ATP-binding protein [Effusibacillus pohliae]